MLHDIGIRTLPRAYAHGAGELLPDKVWLMNMHAFPKSSFTCTSTAV